MYRPPGGTVKFGERSKDCIIREIREELQAEVKELRHVGTIENVFEYEGELGHEIVFVYEAKFVNEAMYDKPQMPATESDGTKYNVLWKPLDEFRTGKSRIVPDGILALLGNLENNKH